MEHVKRPGDAGKDTLKVIMFHVGRSGSRVLGDMLNQHPEVDWAREIFLPFIRSENSKVQLAPFEFLHDRLLAAKSNVFGIELKFFHLRELKIELTDFFELAKEMGFDRFIILRRLNLLRKIVSSMVAHQTGKWHMSANHTPRFTPIMIAPAQISIDRTQNTLLALLEEYEANFQELEDLLSGETSLHLTYEDHVLNDPAAGFVHVCDFLGLRPCPVKIRYGQTNPYRLSDLIVNFQELERVLAGTPFEWMLYA